MRKNFFKKLSSLLTVFAVVLTMLSSSVLATENEQVEVDENVIVFDCDSIDYSDEDFTIEFENGITLTIGPEEPPKTRLFAIVTLDLVKIDYNIVKTDTPVLTTYCKMTNPIGNPGKMDVKLVQGLKTLYIYNVAVNSRAEFSAIEGGTQYSVYARSPSAPGTYEICVFDF